MQKPLLCEKPSEMAMPFFWSHFSIPGMLLQSTNARVSLCSGLLRLTVTVPYSYSSSLPIIWMEIVLLFL